MVYFCSYYCYGIAYSSMECGSISREKSIGSTLATDCYVSPSRSLPQVRCLCLLGIRKGDVCPLGVQ